MNVAMLGDVFIGWGGGIDFLCAYIRPLIQMETVTPFLFLHKTKRYNDSPSSISNNFTLADAVTFFKNNYSDIKIVLYDMTGNDFERQLQYNKIDIIFPTIVDLTNKVSIPWIPYIADFQHKYYPNFFSKEECEERDHFFHNMLSNSKVSFVEAEDVKKDIVKYYPSISNNIFVMPYTAIPKEDWLYLDDVNIEKYKLPDQYFIISNQLWIHKDHATAIKALKFLHDDGYNNIHLVCTGAVNDYRAEGLFNNILHLVETLNLNNYVHFLGYIQKREQIKMIVHSIAVIQPTLFEGNPGGGSAYDAVSLGVPLILSDIAINKELKEERVNFFHVGNSVHLKEKMIDVLLDAKTYIRYSAEILKKRGENRMMCLQDRIQEMLRSAIDSYTLG